jgi:hypothetical protein
MTMRAVLSGLPQDRVPPDLESAHWSVLAVEARIGFASPVRAFFYARSGHPASGAAAPYSSHGTASGR